MALFLQHCPTKGKRKYEGLRHDRTSHQRQAISLTVASLIEPEGIFAALIADAGNQLRQTIGHTHKQYSVTVVATTTA
jgi:hypothetical protein